MTINVVDTATASAVTLEPPPIDLDELAPWDRWHGAFAADEAVQRLWSSFGIDATRDRIFSGDAPQSEPESSADRVAVSWLRRMATDRDKGLRERLYPKAGTLGAIGGLMETAPNFRAVLQLVRTAVAAAFHTTTPIRIPPVLLLGPPGIGKTHVSQKIAAALGTIVTRVDFAGGTALSPLGGSHRVWRGAEPGCVARALIQSKTCSPILLLDEIDKPHMTSDGADSTAVLHTLLEPEQASKFRDDCLEVHFRAEECLWIATANSAANMPRSLIDRFLVVDVAAPSVDQMRIIVRTLFDEIGQARYPHWFEGPVSDVVVDRIRAAHPRRARRIIEVACQMAAAARRTIVTTWDVIAAEKLFGEEVG